MGVDEAADDYADRFPNFIPEVNVVDVVRARLVCSSPTQMKSFLRTFENGYWLVVWSIFYIFLHIGHHHPN